MDKEASPDVESPRMEHTPLITRKDSYVPLKTAATDTKEASSGYFRTDCRLCGARTLEQFLDFGLQPHSDGFVTADMLNKAEPVFPLAMAFCPDCGQVQITYVVKPELLYGDEYLYDSTITETGKKHFLGMAQSIVEKFGIPADSLAVDIGSNTGLLLSGFRDQGLRVQGVDPTPKMTQIAIDKGIDTVVECFSSQVAKQIVQNKGKASVITGTNVIAHIDDLEDLMKGIDILLADDGIFVMEAPYLGDLIRHLEYDTVYHQHLSYFGISPLARFFKRFGMDMFHVERTSIHGGSIRVFACRSGMRSVEASVAEMIQEEEASGLLTSGCMREFAARVAQHKTDLVTLLMSLKDKDCTIAGIGAPAKGSTLLNYCGINPSILSFTTEKNPFKVGRFTPGTHIPILTDEQLLAAKPAYALILPWNFAPEIMKNLQAFRNAGGKFIIPIPTPAIV